MPFTVEDGTGILDANSYASVEDADDYHTLHNNSGWTGTNDEKQAALIRASRWVDARYRDRWPGHRLRGRTQGLEWPRYSAYDTRGALLSSEEIPVEVLWATFEAALKDREEPGFLNPSVASSDRVKEESIGPIRMEYFNPVSPSLTIVDDLLSTLIPVSRVGGIITAFPMRM